MGLCSLPCPHWCLVSRRGHFPGKGGLLRAGRDGPGPELSQQGFQEEDRPILIISQLGAFSRQLEHGAWGLAAGFKVGLVRDGEEGHRTWDSGRIVFFHF